jgi:4-amino-4-deoxy-L-arabinose transferase-like glycosyltransferase
MAAALLALFLFLAATSALQHSAVQHERHYIYAGVQNLRHGIQSIAAGTPNGLIQLAALPLMFMGLDTYDGPAAAHGAFVNRFLYENRIPASSILAAARTPFLALGAVLGIFIFCWARQLYGHAGGLLALGLYASSPAMLAHTQFANQDFGVACLSFIALYTLWSLCQRITAGRILAAGIAMGLALLTKFTAAVLVPVSLLVPLWDALARDGHDRIRCLARRTLAVAVIWVIAGLVVWADYGFTVDSLGATRLDLHQAHPGAFGGVCPIGASQPGWTLPAPHFFCGLSSQFSHGQEGHLNYFRGEISDQGWWDYYLVTLLYKLPVPLLLLLAVRLGIGVWGLLQGTRRGEGRFLLFFPVLILLVFSLAKTQLGERYILPAYPFLFVWAGGLLQRGWPSGWPRFAMILLLAWLAIGTVRIHPHYLMYFNEIAGGPTRGWKTIVAGYDLGQDLGNLQRYVLEQRFPARDASRCGSGTFRIGLSPAARLEGTQR